MEKENGSGKQDTNNYSHDMETYKERFLQAQRIAQIGYWEWDMQNHRIYWSDEWIGKANRNGAGVLS